MNKDLKKQLNLKPHFNISDSIPILDINDEGIMETRKGLYCKTYKLQDINYSISRMMERGEVFLEWEHVLNRLSPKQQLQFNIYNHQINVDYIEDDVFLREVGDGKDYLRGAYNDIIKKNLMEGHNNIRKDKYITLSLEANDIIAASQGFSTLESDIANILRGISGCDITPLKSIEKLNLIHSLYNSNDANEFKEYHKLNNETVGCFNLENMYEQGITVKDLVQPSSMEFKSRYFKLGKRFCRGLDLLGLPTVMNDQFLNDITAVDFDMLLSMNIEQLDTITANNLVQNQLTNAGGKVVEAQKKASASGYSADIINPKLMDDMAEAKELLADMQNRNQKLFVMKLHILIYADNLKELDSNTAKIMNIANGRLVRFGVADGMQELTLNSTLPYGFDCTVWGRTLTTESLAIFIPFNAQEVIQRGGVYYGINAVTKNIVTFDRMTGDNYNAFIFGSSGSGKSFTAKNVILSTYLNTNKECDIIVIDPQGEYGRLAKEVGGVEVVLTGAGEHHINPMDLDEGYSDAPVSDKISFLQSMCGEMLNYQPTSVQKTFISMAGKACYDKWQLSNNPDDLPTLEDFYNELVDMYNQDENGGLSEILDLIMTIKNYVAGVDTLFQGKTNVDVNSNFIVYNTQKLGKNVQKLAMLTILDSILNRICRNRELGRPTYFYVDEIHLLFKSPETAQWLQMLWKTARKFLGAPCGITQDLEDLLGSEYGRTIINNTSFIIMLKLTAQNREILAHELGLSATQLSFVGNNVPKGSGLLYMQGSDKLPSGGVIPFRNHVPADNDIFKIVSSTPEKA